MVHTHFWCVVVVIFKYRVSVNLHVQFYFTIASQFYVYANVEIYVHKKVELYIDAFMCWKKAKLDRAEQ